MHPDARKMADKIHDLVTMIRNCNDLDEPVQGRTLELLEDKAHSAVEDLAEWGSEAEEMANQNAEMYEKLASKKG